MSVLAQSVLETLVFFDAQKRPLSLLEILLYLGKSREQTSLNRISRLLETELEGDVETDGVFYCLKGKKHLLRERHERYRTSLRRMRKSKKYIYFLRFLPFVRGVAVSGSQALLGSRASSDIDLFIITARNRIWLARTFVTLFFQLTGSRRHGNKTRDRFCLNHYIDEEVRIEKDKNLYTAALYASFLPAFGLEHFQEFYKKNQWTKDYLNRPIGSPANNFFGYARARGQRAFELVLDLTMLAPLFNRLSRLYQKSRIAKQDFVYVSDKELSFHPNSRGQNILAEFGQNKLKFLKRKAREGG
jgi:hypothetical protein